MVQAGAILGSQMARGFGSDEQEIHTEVTSVSHPGHCSEKDAKLAQKLGQLQPFIAVFPQECMGQLGSFGPT
jgi:hypothetical protein